VGLQLPPYLSILLGFAGVNVPQSPIYQV
jgi:hypothetical protein